jgi:hypothetical protein
VSSHDCVPSFKLGLALYIITDSSIARIS